MWNDTVNILKEKKHLQFKWLFEGYKLLKYLMHSICE